jgi:hypothetical protein
VPFEICITLWRYDIERAAVIVPPHWKTSAIDDDLTTHTQTYDMACETLQDASLRLKAAGVPVRREKIVAILYDKRY